MRLAVQRVRSARVSLDPGEVVGEIGRGLLVLVGIASEDGVLELRWACDKLLNMRIFADADGKTNLDLRSVSGSLLLVSQFTLYADLARGRRPSFTGAAPGPLARERFDQLVERLRAQGVGVATGAFGEEMLVELVNEGPFTVWLDSSTALDAAKP
jgi:D-tyrosyl-tRNA(Tyr) deacylase